MGSNNCVSNCGRVLLVTLNILFLIIGFVLLLLGILVFAYTPALDYVLAAATSAFEGSISGQATDVTFTADRLLSIIQLFAYILIGLGAFFFIMALLGIIGACCKVKCVLIVYIILMVLLIVAQIALMVIIFSERQVIEPSMKQPMLDMTMKYTGSTGENGETITLNFLMISLSCCGVNNYEDFNSSIESGSWVNKDLKTPLVCCVTPNKSDDSCAKHPDYKNAELNNAEKGCYQALWDYIDDESDLAIGISSAIIILQAILVLFAIYIVYKESKTEVGFS
ncbi:hypothetical protein LOTGIDRAFT_174860 [Lottia gigantea]|uniref:Tetraspanin n=1 Tax=Lottia gigantea TaxID=225164 RepID=V3ZXV8_LOTGI|nr:hypothetical protein LOTGIDRAFT_174860 [Lottia gigantea]ESO96338.1 hypothetical protein LOTGIDRAFT_174860 [Lottia gigantea]